MIGVWRQVAGRTWDKAEFEALFLAHYEGIYRLLFRMVGTAEEAEDLAQETFLRLYRRCSLREGEHNVRAWLCRVATNLAYNATREACRRQRRQRRAAADNAQPTMVGADPAEAALRSEERAAARQALMVLPRRQAQLLLLHYAGLSYRELAIALGVAPGSVGTLLARAKAAFAQAYQTTVVSPDGGGSDEM